VIDSWTREDGVWQAPAAAVPCPCVPGRCLACQSICSQTCPSTTPDCPSDGTWQTPPAHSQNHSAVYDRHTHTHSPTSAPVSMGFITSAVGTGLKKQPVIIPLKCLARVCFYISVTEHLNLLNVTVNVLVCIAFWNINYCTFSYTPNRYDRRVFSVVSQKAWNSLADKHIIIIIIIIQHLYSAIVSYAGCRGANYLILVYVACQAFLTILTCNIYLLTYLLPGCNGVNVSSYSQPSQNLQIWPTTVNFCIVLWNIANLINFSIDALMAV